MIRERALAVGLGLLMLVAALVLMFFKGPSGGGVLPSCVFHEITGLHCAGCGMTRATNELIHGRVASAMDYNPAGVVALPLVVGWVVLMVPPWVFGKRGPRWLMPSAKPLWVLLGLVVAYWILRNLPWWPFTLLAPV